MDALLGTGVEGPVRGRYKELIRAINEDFPKAKVVAVDIPSAMQVRADFTVTFAAPKVEMLLGEGAGNVGQLIVGDIGIPDDVLKSDLYLSEAGDFRKLLVPRKADAHKGNFGHVMVIGGARGKGGAAAMSGLAALESGRGIGDGRVRERCSARARIDVAAAGRGGSGEDDGGRDRPGTGRESRVRGDG